MIPYSNCFRWRTRRELVNDCIRHLRGMANVDLHVVELAYGDRPFEVTGGHVNDVQLRTESELWHKEQLINIGVSRFPVDWKYGAYVDGDFHSPAMTWPSKPFISCNMAISCSCSAPTRI